MSLVKRLPPSILGGDPFNQFRFLYRRNLLWKLFDEEYCISVMRAYYEAGGRAFDLSFPENARLFKRLIAETQEELLGFGNSSWEQGVFFNGRYLQYSRDRLLRTLVERFFSEDVAKKIKEKLYYEDVLVFHYDREAEILSDKEIASIYLNEDAFLERLKLFEDCQYLLLGGADADWLVPMGRIDIIQDMAKIAQERGFTPFVLTQFATVVVPALEDAGVDVAGYAVPINRAWSWFDRDQCVEIIKEVDKPVIAFMAFAGEGPQKDIRGAMDWLYHDVGVESILFGTSTAEHASETYKLAWESRSVKL